MKLIAVDHPAGVEIFTQRQVQIAAVSRVPAVRRERGASIPCARATTEGRDVLPRLLHRDRTYPDGFRRDYLDVAELHHLDLDFGKAAPA